MRAVANRDFRDWKKRRLYDGGMQRRYNIKHTATSVSVSREARETTTLIRATSVVAFGILVARWRKQATLVNVCIRNTRVTDESLTDWTQTSGTQILLLYIWFYLHVYAIFCGYWHQWADERHGSPPPRSRSLKWWETKMEDSRRDLGEQVHGMRYFSFQCFDTVGWAAGSAPGL